MEKNLLIVIEVCLVIITVLILIFSALLISLIVQVKRSTREVEKVIRNLGQDLSPLILKIKETADNIHEISEHISNGVAVTANAVRAVENTVKNISQASSLLSARNLWKKVLASGIWIGVKAGFNVLKKRMSSRKM